MAKTMARIHGDVVINLLWCADSEAETDNLKEIGDCRVSIGDTYDGGRFYRDGELLLTPLEQIRREYEELSCEVDEYVVDHEYRITLLELGV